MQKRRACAAFLGLALLLMQAGLYSQSQAEYAEQKMEDWTRTNASMNKAYAVLLRQADDEPNKAPAQELRDAKEAWEKFRALFCRSVSTTYGGMWASVHDSECRVKLAKDFEKTMGDYGW